MAALNTEAGKPDREYLCILWVTVVTFMGFYGPQPLLPTISREFQTSQPLAGLMMTLTILPFTAGPFIYGKILRFLSARQLICCLIPLAALTLVPPVAAPWFSVVLFCRLCYGVTLSGILMCLTARIAEKYTGQKLQRTMTLYAAITIVGGFFGRVLCGYIGTHACWQAAFAVLAILQISALLPAYFLRNDTANRDSAAFGLRDIAGLFSSKALRALMLIGPLCIFCHASVLNLIPFYLHRLDPNLNDFMIGLVYLTGLFSSAIGFASKSIITFIGGEWRVITAGLWILIASMFFLFLENIAGAAAAMLGTCIGFALIYTTIPGLINRAAWKSKNLLNSVYLGIYYLFSALGAYIPLLIFDRGGLLAYEVVIIGVFTSVFFLIKAARHAMQQN